MCVGTARRMGSVFAFAAIATVPFASIDRAGAALGICNVNAIAVRDIQDLFGTTSTTGVDIPHMSVTFTLAAPGCVVAEFTANASADNTFENSSVLFDLDNGQLVAPKTFGNKIATGRTEVLTAKYVFFNLPAGTHSVKMKLQSDNGTKIYVSYKTLLVHYRK